MTTLHRIACVLALVCGLLAPLSAGAVGAPALNYGGFEWLEGPEGDMVSQARFEVTTFDKHVKDMRLFGQAFEIRSALDFAGLGFMDEESTPVSFSAQPSAYIRKQLGGSWSADILGLHESNGQEVTADPEATSAGWNRIGARANAHYTYQDWTFDGMAFAYWVADSESSALTARKTFGDPDSKFGAQAEAQVTHATLGTWFVRYEPELLFTGLGLPMFEGSEFQPFAYYMLGNGPFFTQPDKHVNQFGIALTTQGD